MPSSWPSSSSTRLLFESDWCRTGRDLAPPQPLRVVVYRLSNCHLFALLLSTYPMPLLSFAYEFNSNLLLCEKRAMLHRSLVVRRPQAHQTEPNSKSDEGSSLEPSVSMCWSHQADDAPASFARSGSMSLHSIFTSITIPVCWSSTGTSSQS